MIEQHDSLLQISFPSPEAAKAFHLFLQSLLQGPGSSELPSGLLPLLPPSPPDSPEQEPSPAQLFRSHHVVLTEERQEQLFNQRQDGQTAHQRILRAQTTLRDGVLPFSKPGEVPRPTNQPSPRMRGVFADGEPKATALPAPAGPTAPQLSPAASINPSVAVVPPRTRLQRSPQP